MSLQHEAEIKSGDRFSFGKNWSQFLKLLNEERITLAEKSLCHMLKVSDLKGKKFLDIGSGSGLFSLAAKRLGATVHSFDFDPYSFACTQELKNRFFANDSNWTVEQGSALDLDYLNSLGKFDIVYSWGVLHHTGNMHLALDNASKMVAEKGTLFIAIYNDQGRSSKQWLAVKKAYCALPNSLKWLILWPGAIRFWGLVSIIDLLKGKPFYSWKNHGKGSSRGMDAWRDLVDWIGGLPFEVATPELIFSFYQERGFKLEKLKTCAGGIGCNEFVFSKS